MVDVPSLLNGRLSHVWLWESQAFIAWHHGHRKRRLNGVAWALVVLEPCLIFSMAAINGLRSPEIDDAKGLIILRFESLNVLNVYQVSGAAFHPTISTVTPPQDGPLCKSPHAKFT